MFPVINKKETGINLRKIMDERNFRKPIAKDMAALKMCEESSKRLYTYYVKLNKGLVA